MSAGVFTLETPREIVGAQSTSLQQDVAVAFSVGKRGFGWVQYSTVKPNFTMKTALKSIKPDLKQQVLNAGGL